MRGRKRKPDCKLYVCMLTTEARCHLAAQSRSFKCGMLLAGSSYRQHTCRVPSKQTTQKFVTYEPAVSAVHSWGAVWATKLFSRWGCIHICSGASFSLAEGKVSRADSVHCFLSSAPQPAWQLWFANCLFWPAYDASLVMLFHDSIKL